MFSARSYLTSHRSFRFLMILPRKCLMVAMNYSSDLTGIACPSGFPGGFVHVSLQGCSACLDGGMVSIESCFVWLDAGRVGALEEDVLPTFRDIAEASGGQFQGEGSAADGSHRIQAKADTVCRGRIAVGANGGMVRFYVRWYVSCQDGMSRWCGWERSHNRMLLTQLDIVPSVPFWARVSASLFPRIFSCDEVHYPLILQHSNCRPCPSSGYALTYPLPGIGPPERALSACWLSKPSQLMQFAVPLLVSSLNPSSIVWILTSSMLQDLPSRQSPSNYRLDFWSRDTVPSAAYSAVVQFRSVTEPAHVVVLAGLRPFYEGRSFLCFARAGYFRLWDRREAVVRRVFLRSCQGD